MHGHGHGHRFSFHKAHKLDDPARQQSQPTEPLIERLGLRRGHRVLDVGAGTGYVAIPILRRLASLGGGTVVAADIEPRMLDRVFTRATEMGLSSMLDTLRIEESEPNRLPMADGSIHVAVLVNLYHELTDRIAMLREVGRVLRDDGELWVVDWDPDGTVEIGPPREHRVPPDVAWRELLESGFQSVQRLPLYLHHYTLNARRQ